MEWSQHEAVAKKWREDTHAYVKAINAWVKRGNAEGWDAVGEQPADPRTPADGVAVANIVRAANEAGAWRDLRERLPTAHAPFIPLLDDKAVTIRSVRFIDEDRVVASIGSPWQPEVVMVFAFDGEAEHEPGGALDVGTSPNRRFFALLDERVIRVTDGWGGELIATFPRPRGDEHTPEGVETLDDDDDFAAVEGLAVLPDGSGVVVASSRGVFLSRANGMLRLSPSRDTLRENAEGWDHAEPYPLRTDMTHVAVHPDGELIACGYQDSQHELRKLDGTLVSAFGPLHSEYPHHAAFSPDGERAIFNSCHFYNGATFVGRVEDLDGLRVPRYEEHVSILPLDGRCRVYDSAFVDGSFLLGDAGGYVHAVKPSGDALYNRFVGSTIGGVDVSPSGNRIAIGTVAGFLSLVERDTETDLAQIGTSPFQERIRYIRWAGESLWRW